MEELKVLYDQAQLVSRSVWDATKKEVRDAFNAWDNGESKKIIELEERFEHLKNNKLNWSRKREKGNFTCEEVDCLQIWPIIAAREAEKAFPGLLEAKQKVELLTAKITQMRDDELNELARKIDTVKKAYKDVLTEKPHWYRCI